MTKNRYHILWILILAAVLRFVQIDAPPVGRHAWRQCDTASVARNFHHNGNRLLYPQIDWEVPGFVEMEFPVYPWTASLLYGLAGESDAIARALAILGSLVTIAFLYLLVTRILGRRTALWSAFLYAVLPVNLFFGRAIMPESWMLAATAAAMYCFVRWIDEDSWLFYCLALLATTLACLLKLTSLYLGLPLLWLAWQRWGRRSLGRWQFWLFAGLVTIPLILWYGHAYRLGQEFGASFHIFTAPGTDKWGAWRLLADPDFYHRVFLGYLGGRMLTWVGLPIFVVGLFLHRLSARERLFDVWLLAVTLVLLLANGGSYQHDYYSLPIVLPAVVFMGKVFDRGWTTRKPWLIGAAVLIFILSGYRHLGTLAEERQPGTDSIIAEALASATTRDDLVISCNGANPVWLHLADRRGWGRNCDRLDKPALQDLIRRGARYLVARGSIGSALPTRQRLSSYSHTFFEVLEEDEVLLLVRLDALRRFEDLAWDPVWVEDFTDAASLDSMRFHGGSWNVGDGSLLGTRERQPAEARTRDLLPPCQICRVQISLALIRPPDRDAILGRPQLHRGSGRSDAQSSIDLWWQDPGTGITITLATKSGSITLQQFENGTRLGSKRIEFPLVEGRDMNLEVRSDAFEIELLVNGQSVLTTANRLTTPLAGRLALRPRLGSIRLDQLDMRVPEGSISHLGRYLPAPGVGQP